MRFLTCGARNATLPWRDDPVVELCEVLRSRRMKDTCGTRMPIAAGAACAAGLVASAVGWGQSNQSPRPISAARAQNIARRIELNATNLTVFDRQGKAVATVKPRALYGN